MTVELVLDQPPTATEQPIKPPAPARKRRAPPSASSATVLTETTPVAEPIPPTPTTKPKKPRQPFTVGELAAIKRLGRNGVAANEIAKAIGRANNYPQVASLLRQFGLGKPTVSLQLGESKTNCPAKIRDLLAAAAKRRSVSPAQLAVQIIDGVLQHGSLTHVLRDDAAALVDEFRTVKVVLSLEAVGGANGACRDYKLRAVGLTHGERPG